MCKGVALFVRSTMLGMMPVSTERKRGAERPIALHPFYLLCESTAVCTCCPLKAVTTWDVIMTVLPIVGGLLGPNGAAFKSSTEAEVGRGGGALRC